MYAMNALPVRVLPGGLAPAATRCGDYDALVRLARRAPPRPTERRETGAGPRAGKHAGHPAAADTCTGESTAASDRHPDQSPAPREHVHAPLAARHTSARATLPANANANAQQRTPIECRIEALAAPCVGAIVELRQEFDGWVRFLVERAADFCCDRAVGTQGQWAIRLTLDPAILPDCALHLTLSHFTLALRFEAQTNASRQLVLHHSQTLKAQLAAVLAERGEPREIEIAVD